MSLSGYEQRRLKNLAENRRILGELGAIAAPPQSARKLSAPPLASSKRRSLAPLSTKKIYKTSEKTGVDSKNGKIDDGDDDADAVLARRLAAADEEAMSRRSSRRLEGRPAPRYAGQCDGYGKDDSGEENWTPSGGRRGRRRGGEDDDGEDSDEDYQSEDSDSEGEGRIGRRSRSGAALSGSSVFDRPKVAKNRPNVYGAMPNVAVGTLFETRIDACLAGLHRPTVAGIHGGTEGAYSIALSGGYEDDIDLGSHFSYTGEGGRDLKGTKSNPKNLRTAPQTKDQALTRNNAALVKSAENGQPVRVIRGYKLKSEFAPPEGYYRYDGLYRVEKWWYATGMAGFGVYKFAFKRIPDQAPAPWEEGAAESAVYNFRTDYKPEEEPLNSPPDRVQSDNKDCEKGTENRLASVTAKKERKKKSAATDTAASAAGPVELDYEAVMSGQVDVDLKSCDTVVNNENKDPIAAKSPSAAATPLAISNSSVPDGEKKRRDRKSKIREVDTAPTEISFSKETSVASVIDSQVKKINTDSSMSKRLSIGCGRKPKSNLTVNHQPQQQQQPSKAVTNPISSPPRKKSRFFFE